jgi:hypothetical protein
MSFSSYFLFPSSQTHPFAYMMYHLGDSVVEIGKRWKWRRTNALLDLSSKHEEVNYFLSRLMSTYIGTENASVDLVAAVSLCYLAS